MHISNQNTWHDSYLLSMTKSFLVWNLTLTVCFFSCRLSVSGSIDDGGGFSRSSFTVRFPR